MNIRHFFDNADEKTIDRITENYPLLNSKDKERLYAMSKKKYNRVQTENSPNTIEVSGVERYRKPVWHKVLSAVAAAVVVLGGIGGSVALMRRNNDVNISENELSQFAEIEGIAQQLTDEFFDLKNIISSRGASYDENDTLIYKIGIFDDALENPEQYTYERIFYKVTDERFSNAQDIYNALRNITSSTYFPEEKYEKAIITWEIIYDYVNEETVYPELFHRLGTDVSIFENGSEIGREYFFDAEGNPIDGSSIDLEDDIDWETPYCIWESDYIEHSGSLYMISPDYVYDPVGVVYDYNDTIEITDVTESSFTAVRYADISHNENIIKRAEFKFLYMDGEWLIDKFSESVLDKEGIGSEETDFTAIAQQLSDKLLEFEKIVQDADVEYDANDSISFYRYSSVNPDTEDEEVRYCRVTDERFNSCQDIYNYIRSFTSFKLEPKDDYINAGWLNDCSIISWLGNDLSEYEIGDRIDINYYRLGHYINYRGQLYVVPIEDDDYVFREYTSDVTIKETGENSFIAARSYTKHYADEDVTVERCFEIVLEAGKWKIDNVYISDEESEEEDITEDDYTAIAQQLFDDYLEVERIIRWGDVSYDENDSITFYTYNSNDAEWSDNNVGERTFYKVTDERFSSCQDIYEMLRAITTTECEPEENFMNADWFDQVNLSSSLGGDVSMFEVGENIDINHEISDWRWPGYSINRSVFVEYNGELYVNRRYSETPKFTSDVIINETSGNSFTATRNYKSPVNSVEEYYNFEFALENGEWKINHVMNN